MLKDAPLGIVWDKSWRSGIDLAQTCPPRECKDLLPLESFPLCSAETAVLLSGGAAGQC